MAALDEFFSLVDSGAIFQSADPDFYVSMRSGLRNGLLSLLVWRRPELEVARGLMWPYDGFAMRHRLFTETAEKGAARFVREQARKFLAFFPFPGQWSWMARVENENGNEHEVKTFLSLEEAEISRKIGLKPQKHFKLRHFCQILKSPMTGGGKGILRIFSLPYLFTRQDLLRRLSSRYVLFVEPPMGVVFRHLWWRHFAVLEDPCVMGVSSMEDVLFLRGQANVEPIQLAHGDFLDESAPQAPGPERQYDIVFNASFDDMERKRHDLMLQLLLHPLLRSTKALFLGRGSGDNVEKLEEQVVHRGLGSRVTVLANLKRSEVPEWLGRCRMGVHLSLYENACRSIYEFFRSDLPCVISSSMGGMNLDHFAGKTGEAVKDGELPDAIASVLGNERKYEPRKWFLAHSGSRNSSRKLNAILRGLFEKWGYEWRSDIVPLGSSGASRYIDASSCEHFRAEFEWILECFRNSADPRLTFSID
jgi:hypothetical protein